MATANKDYYGWQALRQSLMHFVLGKAGTALSTLAALILVVDQLPTDHFAAYATLHAVVLFVGLIASFGVNALVLRFVPELRNSNDNVSAYKMLSLGVAARALLYGAVAALCIAIAPVLVEKLSLVGWQYLFAPYLLVGLLRISAVFLASGLESMLWQREAQYSFAIAGIGKLALVIWAIRSGSLDLPTLVYIEMFAEGLAAMLMIFGGLRRWRADDQRQAGDPGTLRDNAARYRRFAGWAYAQNLTAVFAGSAPTRLFVSMFFGTQAIAAYAVVDRLAEYVKQYEPTRLFLGLIRPMFNARYQGPGDFAGLSQTADGLMRANLTILAIGFVLLTALAPTLTQSLSDGAYVEITDLLVCMYALAATFSLNTLIEVQVKMTEQTQINSLSNLALSLSLLTAIPLVDHFGLWAIAIAQGIGIASALAIVLTYMKSRGYPIALSLGLIVRLGLVTAAAATVASQFTGPVTRCAAGLIAIALLLLMCPPFSKGELALGKDLARKALRGRRGVA